MLTMIGRPCILGAVVGVLLVVFASRAVAGPFEEGLSAYGRGDHQSALRIWRPLAEGGDAAAQFNVGLLYDTGQGVPEDPAAAAHWYRLAADQGYAKAQLNLGDLYAADRGVPQDFLEAAKLYEEAAKQRNANARYKLGYLYHHGRGVSQDLKQAIRLYQQAADQGLAEAQLMLGILYSLGEAVPQDLQTAYVWLSLAMAFGSSDEGRAKAKTSLEIIEAKMNSEQIAMARQRAREWKPRVSP
jgi:TPR repeat protein